MRANRADVPTLDVDPRWRAFLPWLALASLVLLTRPFEGIYHDAHLYAAQVLRYLGSTALETDVYFAFGNQDDFTIFTPLYALLVQALGLEKAYILAYAAGLSVWFAAAFTLANVFFEDPRARYLSLLGAVALSASYGNGALSYAEGFVTPRIFAEAFGMLGVAALLRGNWFAALLSAIVSVALHPLMGLVILALLLKFALRDVRIFLLAAIMGLSCIAGLGLAGLEPFSWVWERMDAQWFALTWDHTPLVFVSGWGLQGYATLPLKLLIFAILILHDAGQRRKAALDTLTVCVLLVGVSFIAADLLGNRLFVALQLWRVLFFFALFANMMAIRAALLVPPGQVRRFLILAIAANLFEVAMDLSPIFSACFALVALLGLSMKRYRHSGAALLTRLTGFLALAFVTLGIATLLLANLTDPDRLAGLWPVVFFLSAIVGVASLHGRLVHRYIGVILSVIALAGALWTLDRRPDWEKFVDFHDPSVEELRELVDGKSVYWENGLSLLWFKIRQPQYYSCRQKAGSVFFRPQAFEIIRRAEILAELDTSDFSDDPSSDCPMKVRPLQNGPTDAGQFEKVCKAAPELELIVLRTRLPGAYRDVWIAPVTQKIKLTGAPERLTRIPFFFYHCADFRI